MTEHDPTHLPIPVDPYEPALATVAHEWTRRPQNALQQVIGNLAQHASTTIGETHPGTSPAAEMVTYTNTESAAIVDALGDDKYSTDDLRSTIALINGLTSAIGFNMSAFLGAAKPEALQELYRSADLETLVMLHNVPALLLYKEDEPKEIQRERATELLFMLERTVEPLHGRIATWRKKGRPQGTLPDFLQSAAWNPAFAGASAESEAIHIKTENDGHGLKERLKLRDAERTILSAIGVPKEMSHDYRLSLRSRTVRRSANEEKIGDINTHLWTTAIGDYGYNFARLGPRRAQELHRTCDIVNLDRYSDAQLLRNHRVLVEQDPDAIAKLLSGNVTVVFTDAYDPNGFGGHAPGYFESENTLFFEIKQSRDILRHFAQLRRMGIKPATVVMGTHGIEGALVGGDASAPYIITAEAIKESAAVATIVDECMQPHSETGERLVIVDSCVGAAGGEYAVGYAIASAGSRHSNLAVRAFTKKVYPQPVGSPQKIRFDSPMRSLARGMRVVRRPAGVVEYRRTRPPLPDKIITSKRVPGTLK